MLYSKVINIEINYDAILLPGRGHRNWTQMTTEGLLKGCYYYKLQDHLCNYLFFCDFHEEQGIRSLIESVHITISGFAIILHLLTFSWNYCKIHERRINILPKRGNRANDKNAWWIRCTLNSSGYSDVVVDLMLYFAEKLPSKAGFWMILHTFGGEICWFVEDPRIPDRSGILQLLFLEPADISDRKSVV